MKFQISIQDPLVSQSHIQILVVQASYVPGVLECRHIHASPSIQEVGVRKTFWLRIGHKVSTEFISAFFRNAGIFLTPIVCHSGSVCITPSQDQFRILPYQLSFFSRLDLLFFFLFLKKGRFEAVVKILSTTEREA